MTDNIRKLTKNMQDTPFDENALKTELVKFCSAHGLDKTEKVISFAETKHAGQTRKPGHGKKLFRTSFTR